MNQEHVQNLIAYILMLAAQRDEWKERTLRPIHILKYMYLADLAYAERHQGQTWTGIPWRFHRFGPWDEEGYFAIEPAARRIGVEPDVIPMDFGDRTGYRASRTIVEDHYDRIDGALPVDVTGAVQRAMREHTNDTSALLNAVYATDPMRHTAPGDPLDLAEVPPAPQGRPSSKTKLSDKSLKRLKNAKARLGALHRELCQREDRDSAPLHSTSHDVAQEQVRAWLDSMGGEQPPEARISIQIDDSVWGSGARGTSKVP